MLEAGTSRRDGGEKYMLVRDRHGGWVEEGERSCELDG